MLVHDTYSQPDAVDPVLDARTVLGLVRRHGVRGSAVTAVDETGGEARVYVVDEALVVKVQRPHRRRPRTSLAKEAFFLQQLSAHPDLVVPRILGYGRQDPIEYIVMTRMPGVSALTVELTEGARVDGQGGSCSRMVRRISSRPASDRARASKGVWPVSNS